MGAVLVLTSQVCTRGLQQGVWGVAACTTLRPFSGSGTDGSRTEREAQDQAPTSEPLHPMPSPWASHLAGQALAHTRTLPCGWTRAST